MVKSKQDSASPFEVQKFTVKAIRLALDVSHPYATNIRRGTSIPHARHWVKLAELTRYQR